MQEVRVLQGDQADLLLTMLFSLNGDGTNGPESGRFDTLPAGWGLGLSSDFVDLDSFDEIRLKSTFRRYLLTEPMNLEEYLTHLAMTTSALCIWQLDGRLKIKGRGDVYPEQKTTTIDNDALVITNENGALPSLVLDGSRIANIAKLSANYNVDGQALYSETIIESESVKFYGSRTLPGIDDKGSSTSAESVSSRRRSKQSSSSARLLVRSCRSRSSSTLTKPTNPETWSLLPSATSQTSRARRPDTVRPTSSR